MKKLLAIALLVLAGCAQIGVAPPQSFDQQLAYGYGTITAVRTSAAQALQSQTIQVADAQQVLTATDTARTGLDAAKAASGLGDTTTATGKLTAAMAVLTQVQQFLTTKGVK